MAKKPRRPDSRSRSRKSNIRPNKRTRSGKARTPVVRKRRRVAPKLARLDISVHPTPVIEQRGEISKMGIAKAKRRAIL